MGEAIILGNSGGGSSINGVSDILRVQEGCKVKKGDFISFDTQKEVIESSDYEEGLVVPKYCYKEDTDTNVHNSAFLAMDKDTFVRVTIPETPLYINHSQKTDGFDYRDGNQVSLIQEEVPVPIWTWENDKKTIISIDLICNDAVTTYTIEKNYWVGSPRMLKLSDDTVILCYFAVNTAEKYCIEQICFSISNLKLGYSPENSIPRKIDIIKSMSVLSKHTTDTVYPPFDYREGSFYAFTRNTEIYGISKKDDTSFYFWYNSFNLKEDDCNNTQGVAYHCDGYYTEVVAIEDNSLRLVGESINTEFSTDCDFSKIGRHRFLTNDFDAYPSQANNGHIYLKLKNTAFSSPIDMGKLMLNPRNWCNTATYEFCADYFGSIYVKKLESYGDSKHWVLVARYIDDYGSMRYNHNNSLRLLLLYIEDTTVTTTQLDLPYNEINKDMYYQQRGLGFFYSEGTFGNHDYDYYKMQYPSEQPCNAGELIIKKINDTLYLIVENSLEQIRPFNAYIVNLKFQANKTDQYRYSLSEDEVKNCNFTDYVKNLRNSEDENFNRDFRTTESNIFIERHLTYEDEYESTTRINSTINGGTNIIREFSYIYKITMYDSFTGEKIELFYQDKLGKNGYSFRYLEDGDYQWGTEDALCNDAVVVPSVTRDNDGNVIDKKNIMGVSLQTRQAPDIVKIKKVPKFSDASYNGYKLIFYKDGVGFYTNHTVLGNTMPEDFMAIYNEGIKNKLTGKELCEFIDSKYSG